MDKPFVSGVIASAPSILRASKERRARLLGALSEHSERSKDPDGLSSELVIFSSSLCYPADEYLASRTRTYGRSVSCLLCMLYNE